MASRALLNTKATIAIAQGMARAISREYGDNMRLQNVIQASEGAFAQWPEEIDPKGFRKIGEMLSEFENYVRESNGNISAYVSTVIAMLENLKESLLDNRASLSKVVAVSRLLEAVIAVQNEYDPEYEFEDEYITAALLQSKWNRILEAA